MNCFQFDYFCGYHTALGYICYGDGWLWIAFNLITFVDITQHSETADITEARCELLSIWLLLWISHSCTDGEPYTQIVVNCFQFDYFCGYHTANLRLEILMFLLWIAFNLITFVDITQQCFSSSLWQFCCELLSIWLLLWISHSLFEGIDYVVGVVNCFQFDYFCGYHTAKTALLRWSPLLWIAFNLITFVDITQPSQMPRAFMFSCELLSIWLLLWISHSWQSLMQVTQEVVNCFQFDYFCGYHTALFVFLCVS